MVKLPSNFNNNFDYYPPFSIFTTFPLSCMSRKLYSATFLIFFCTYPDRLYKVLAIKVRKAYNKANSCK